MFKILAMGGGGGGGGAYFMQVMFIASISSVSGT